MTIRNSIRASALSASDVAMNNQPRPTRRGMLIGATTCAATSALGAKMVLAPLSATAQPSVPAETRAIAKEAYIYGFPLVDNYRIQYSYFVDRSGHEYKAPWNQLFSNARVYTPEDKAIQTPNSDTPYSYVLKLRLNRIRHELVTDAEAACTITMVAHRWNVAEMGRFAAWYRDLFGELPSQTLMRHQQSARHHLHAIEPREGDRILAESA